MIYFLQDPSTYEIKIGYTGRELDLRRHEVQAGNPRRLVILHTMPGERSLEGELHERFAHACVEREWFKPVPELLAFMLSLAQEAVKQSTPAPELPQICHLMEPSDYWGLAAEVGQVGPAYRLTCPKCGYPNNHISGEKSEFVTWSGNGRMESIIINGECGHRFAFNLGFHKGDIIVWGADAGLTEFGRRYPNMVEPDLAPTELERLAE